MLDIEVIKKDGTTEPWSRDKVRKAVRKSAERATETLSDGETKKLISIIESKIRLAEVKQISVDKIHNYVEQGLNQINPIIAKSYMDYRNYKKEKTAEYEKLIQDAENIRYNIDEKENSNKEGTLASTKQALIRSNFERNEYVQTFLTREERQAVKDGYIYPHDMDMRLDSMNCCLYDMKNVLKNGFEMGNMWYNEPNTLDVAFDVIGDIALSASSQQYGGFSIPEVDSVLEPYAEKSYRKYYNKYVSMGIDEKDAEQYAEKDVEREFYQGFQGWEYKFNTVSSSRGDYPFTTLTLGLATSKWGKMAAISCLRVRREGQGKNGFKKPVLFPKLVFLYDKNLHGVGCPLEDVYKEGLETSRKTMYPDWLSLTGEGYISSMYKKYGKAISPMGCVDGRETIKYKVDGICFNEDFETVWDEFSEQFEVKGQTGPQDINKIIDLTNENITIYDTKKGYVKLKYIIRNYQENWCDVELSNRKVLRVTTDHPFETENRGVVCAKYLTDNDIISVSTDESDTISYITVRVLRVTRLDIEQYSYDVTTESEHFEVSGVYSHNCRAFLSPWYERGGMYPADENDEPVFIGRFNIGAISLHLPMILAKSRAESRDFYEVLDYYLQLIRGLHLRTYAYLGELRASHNPIGFCEGGFYGGHLKPTDKILPVLASATASFGITAFNELQQLYNGKSLVEDGEFALDVLKHINEKVNQFKEEDGRLYAIYGTPEMYGQLNSDIK